MDDRSLFQGDPGRGCAIAARVGRRSPQPIREKSAGKGRRSVLFTGAGKLL
jgi:hypothetical protein